MTLLAVTTAALCLALLVSPARSIMCYQCNSQLHEGCAQLSFNDTASEYYKLCDGDYEGEAPFCRKTVVELKNVVPRVIRSCGWKKHNLACYHLDDGHHIENVCQCHTDGCNAATSSRLGATLMVAATLLLAVV